jgi:predicted nucleic acid-binding Zn finger protein
VEHYLSFMNCEMTKLWDVIFESQEEFLLCKYHTCPSIVFRLHLQGKDRNIFSLLRVNYYFWLNFSVTFIIQTFFF